MEFDVGDVGELGQRYQMVQGLAVWYKISGPRPKDDCGNAIDNAASSWGLALNEFQQHGPLSNVARFFNI